MAKAKKANPRAEWTKEHLKMLKTRFPKEEHLKDLAHDLGRSEGAIRQKAFAEGITRRVRAAATKKKKSAKRSTARTRVNRDALDVNEE
jgi:hypothetical protein